jgi:hypothetical protein
LKINKNWENLSSDEKSFVNNNLDNLSDSQLDDILGLSSSAVEHHVPIHSSSSQAEEFKKELEHINSLSEKDLMKWGKAHGIPLNDLHAGYSKRKGVGSYAKRQALMTPRALAKGIGSGIDFLNLSDYGGKAGRFFDKLTEGKYAPTEEEKPSAEVAETISEFIPGMLLPTCSDMKQEMLPENVGQGISKKTRRP